MVISVFLHAFLAKIYFAIIVTTHRNSKGLMLFNIIYFIINDINYNIPVNSSIK